jgi:hypothetical protein
VDGDKKEATIDFGKKRRFGDQTWFRYSSPRSGTPRTPQPPSTLVVPGFDSSMQLQLREAMRAAEDATRQARIYSLQAIGTARLGDARVKLDVRNASIRDSLKDILKQAGLDYALEDDVPDDVKRSFTFENVPIATALDVICRSVDIGWSVQRTVETVDPSSRSTDKRSKSKTVVLIGKKYARRTTAFTPAPSLNLFESVPGVRTLFEVLPDLTTPEPVIAPLPPILDGDDILLEEPFDV